MLNTKLLLVSAFLLAAPLVSSPKMCCADGEAQVDFGQPTWSTVWDNLGPLTGDQYFKATPDDDTKYQGVNDTHQPGNSPDTYVFACLTYASLTNTSQSTVTLSPSPDLNFYAFADTSFSNGEASADMSIGSGFASASCYGWGPDHDDNHDLHTGLLTIMVASLGPGDDIQKSGYAHLSASN